MQIFRKMLSLVWPSRYMFNCKDVLHKLSEFVDGELDSSLCRELQKHLIDCQKCKVFVDTFKKTIVILKNTGENEVPQEVHLRLRDFLKKQHIHKN